MMFLDYFLLKPLEVDWDRVSFECLCRQLFHDTLTCCRKISAIYMNKDVEVFNT